LGSFLWSSKKARGLTALLASKHTHIPYLKEKKPNAAGTQDPFLMPVLAADHQVMLVNIDADIPLNWNCFGG